VLRKEVGVRLEFQPLGFVQFFHSSSSAGGGGVSRAKSSKEVPSDRICSLPKKSTKGGAAVDSKKKGDEGKEIRIMKHKGGTQ